MQQGFKTCLAQISRYLHWLYHSKSLTSYIPNSLYKCGWCTQAFRISPSIHSQKGHFLWKDLCMTSFIQEKRQLQSRKQWQVISALLNPCSIKSDCQEVQFKLTSKGQWSVIFKKKNAIKILLLCIATCAFSRPKWDIAQNCTTSQSNLTHCLVILSSKSSSIVSTVYNDSMHHVLSRWMFINLSFFLHTNSLWTVSFIPYSHF